MINIAVDHLGLARSADSSRHDARTLTPAALITSSTDMSGGTCKVRPERSKTSSNDESASAAVPAAWQKTVPGGRAGRPVLAEFLDCTEETFGPQQ